jgi:hypothetical protein
LIEHEEQALSDQTDLQPIPQPPPYPGRYLAEELRALR